MPNSGTSFDTHLLHPRAQHTQLESSDSCTFAANTMHNHYQPAGRQWYTLQLTSAGHLLQAPLRCTQLQAVGSFHRQHGLPDPTRHNHRLKLVLRGATRVHSLNKTVDGHKRHPITHKLLAMLLGRLKKSQSYNKQDKRMLSAAFTLAFYGFLRISEFTSPSHKRFNPHIHPTTSDISWSMNYFYYKLKRSKTDQLHRGQTIYLPCSRRPTCPYTAMKTYLKHSRAT